MTTTTARVLDVIDPALVVKHVHDHMLTCYLTVTPNRWGCHDPQCDDSTWDHDCPTPPCWVGRSEPLPRRES